MPLNVRIFLISFYILYNMILLNYVWLCLCLNILPQVLFVLPNVVNTTLHM